MKKSWVLLAFIFGMFLIANVSAGVYFSQPEQTYNLGDTIINNINIEPVEAGFLKVDLVCGDDSINIFNGVPVDGVAKIEFPLTTAYIQNISGVCHFSGDYSESEYNSRDFKISKNLNIRLDIDSLFAKPGEAIIVSGNVNRLNGMGVDGEVEIRIIGLSSQVIEVEEATNETEIDEVETDDDETDEEATNETEIDEEEEIIIDSYDSGAFFGRVIGGQFSVNFTIAKDTPANDYKISVLVYEQEINGEITSQAIEMANLKISQVLTSIDVALSGQSVDPGSEFNFKPMLLDQTGQNIEGEVSVVIVDDESNRIFERIVQSEKTIDYDLPGEMEAGYYEIKASSGEVEITKKFYINEKSIALFSLTNGTLIVENIGNIKYDRDIQIELNGKPFVKSMSLKLGEIQEFRLTGSDDEEYDIKITDGETEIVQSGVALTGRAIGVKEVGAGLSVAVKTPIIWIFLIIVLGGVALFIFRNALKKKSFAYPFKEKLGKKKVEDLSSGKEEKVEKKGVISKLKDKISSEQSSESPSEVSKLAPGALVAPNKAEQVLVLKGQKNKAAVLVLKIKNKLTKVSKQSLEKAIEPVYSKRGAVYEQGDFVYIIYSPLMTRSSKNEVEAAKAAEKIKLILQEHNKKFKDKIEFGIGINSGNIINKVEDKKLKFTALGNMISGAKRIAESSNEQILVTKEAYERGINEIKAEKKEIKGSQVYEVRSVIDKEKNAKFIAGFLNRMADDKK